MLNILESTSERSIAIEIIDGYEAVDEKLIEELFEKKLAAGITKVNILMKIDKLSITKSSWKAMWNDGLYAMKHISNCGRIAIVGDSKIEEFLVKTDNAFFENKKAGRTEKYFNVEDINVAIGWINE